MLFRFSMKNASSEYKPSIGPVVLDIFLHVLGKSFKNFKLFCKLILTWVLDSGVLDHCINGYKVL